MNARRVPPLHKPFGISFQLQAPEGAAQRHHNKFIKGLMQLNHSARPHLSHPASDEEAASNAARKAKGFLEDNAANLVRKSKVFIPDPNTEPPPHNVGTILCGKMRILGCLELFYTCTKMRVSGSSAFIRVWGSKTPYGTIPGGGGLP